VRSDGVEGLQVAWVSGGRGIMELVKDPGAKGRDVGDADSVFEVPEVVTSAEVARAAGVGVVVEWIIRVGTLDVI
jgi:hypothetical protein